MSCLIQSGFDGKDEVNELELAIQNGYQQIFIQTPKGVLKHHVLRPGKDGEARFIRIPVSEVPGIKMKDISPDIKFLPAGKVPMALLNEVKSFFRAVIVAKGTAVEAMIWVLWSQDRGYYLHVPNQVVGHASAKYDWDGLPANSSIIVDIHSHADFSPFFSGTDNSDDINSIRYSGVIGFNNRPKPESVWRFNYFGLKVDLKIEDIFEEQVVQTPVPSEWLDAVTLTSSAGRPGMGTVYRGPQHYQGMQHQQRIGHFPDPGEERTGTPAGNDWQAGGKRGKDKKKHSGGQETTSGHNKGQSAFWTSGATQRNIVSVNGRNFVDTGEGLVEVKADEIPPSHPMDARLGVNPNFDAEIEAEVNAFLGENISGEAEDRFHQIARRQAQEDILQDMGEVTNLSSELPEEKDIKVGVVSEECPLSPEDIPPEYYGILASHGEHVANAYAIVDHVSIDMVSSPEVLARTVENLFQLLGDEHMLPTFRTIVGLLPQKDIDSLMTNGL